MRSVVVTGTSTGIGWGTAKVLIAHGFRVFGSVRKTSDAERLSAEFGDRFVPLIFDVTDEAAVKAAAAQVRAALARRDARRPGQQCRHRRRRAASRCCRSPNFAIRSRSTSSASSSPPRLSRRSLGTDRALKGAPGRIVNIGSVGGKIAMPFLAPYAASKFALEGLSESLRRELLPFGIDVIVIAPGAVATPIWEQGRAGRHDALS